ncbi:MAG: hypothetical protein ABIH10_01300 [Spirochaetota bacterium]
MFIWSDFFELAKELKTSSGDDAKLRTSISRVYYYALHNSEEFCRAHRISILESVSIEGRPEGSIHLRVINTLRNHDDIDIVYAGQLLNNLKRLRGEADYKIALSNNKLINDADIAIEYAENIKNKFIMKLSSGG